MGSSGARVTIAQYCQDWNKIIVTLNVTLFENNCNIVDNFFSTTYYLKAIFQWHIANYTVHYRKVSIRLQYPWHGKWIAVCESYVNFDFWYWIYNVLFKSNFPMAHRKYIVSFHLQYPLHSKWIAACDIVKTQCVCTMCVQSKWCVNGLRIT